MSLTCQQRLMYCCVMMGAVEKNFPNTIDDKVFEYFDFCLNHMKEPPLTHDERLEIIAVSDICWLHMKTLGLNRKQMRAK